MKWVLSAISNNHLGSKSYNQQLVNIFNLNLLIIIWTRNNYFYFYFIFVILIGKTLSKAVTWTGVGSIDKTFGLTFGIFKGYIVSVCIFSILNWFYPYKNWGISADNAISFNIINKGSKILIEEFPSGEDFIDTKEKLKDLK